MKQRILWSSALVMIAFSAWFAIHGQDFGNSATDWNENKASDSRSETTNTQPAPANETSKEALTAAPKGAQDQPLIEAIRNRFGKNIQHSNVQMKALEKLISYLEKLYPEDWQDRLQDFIYAAFPEHAEHMLALYTSMTKYQHWIDAEKQNLNRLSPQQRQTLIWEMRRSFFGLEADIIWQEALKNYQVAQSLNTINTPGTFSSVSEQQGAYLEALKATYGDELPQLIDSRSQELTDRFLGLEEVQNNLRSLPPEARQANLNDLRRNLGMDDEAIQRWQTLDQQRDQRWTIGRRYMIQKLSLKERLTGQELKQAMKSLQDELFGLEAEIIRNEESSGYFRFEEAQVFGKN